MWPAARWARASKSHPGSNISGQSPGSTISISQRRPAGAAKRLQERSEAAQRWQHEHRRARLVRLVDQPGQAAVQHARHLAGAQIGSERRQRQVDPAFALERDDQPEQAQRIATGLVKVRSARSERRSSTRTHARATALRARRDAGACLDRSRCGCASASPGRAKASASSISAGSIRGVQTPADRTGATVISVSTAPLADTFNDLPDRSTPSPPLRQANHSDAQPIASR